MPNIETPNAGETPDVVEKPELPNRPYLDTAGASDHTGFSESFLNKARMGDDGPDYIKIGRRAVRYRREDLDRWMANHIVSQKPPEPPALPTENSASGMGPRVFPPRKKRKAPGPKRRAPTQDPPEAA